MYAPLAGPSDLSKALLRYETPVLRNYTSNLMAFALGRRVAYYDMPTVRKIVRKAEADGYKTTAFILGIVESEAFRMRGVAPDVADEPDPNDLN